MPELIELIIVCNIEQFLRCSQIVVCYVKCRIISLCIIYLSTRFLEQSSRVALLEQLFTGKTL